VHKVLDLSALLQEGLKFHQSGRLQEAKACYQRILAVDSKHFDALQLSAVLEIQMRRYESALGLFDQAILLNPRNAIVINNRGNALKKIKRLDEALASYDEAIRIRPDFTDAFYN
jgi:tetratricopeptide (TPR) repeat protein